MTIKDAYEMAKEKAMGFPLLETYENSAEARVYRGRIKVD